MMQAVGGGVLGEPEDWPSSLFFFNFVISITKSKIRALMHFNSFIEMQLTYHKIHSFNIYSLGASLFRVVPQ